MIKPWKLISSKVALKTKWLSVDERVYRLPNGKEDIYYHINRPDYVVIIAIDKQQRIVVEQLYRRGVDEVIYELPAGWIDKEESFTDAALRELKEETGFSGKASFIGTLYSVPSLTSMIGQVVLVEIDSVQEKKELANDEQIEAKLIPYEEVKKMVKENTIRDMAFLASLQLYEASL
ncbi:NUDIX hydrolase [soil metagenome]